LYIQKKTGVAQIRNFQRKHTVLTFARDRDALLTSSPTPSNAIYPINHAQRWHRFSSLFLNCGFASLIKQENRRHRRLLTGGRDTSAAKEDA